jgi:hypothetical protein
MMDTMRTVGAAGMAAARARISGQQLDLGYGWHPAASPCDNPNFAMAITTKRQPRRLGQRST